MLQQLDFRHKIRQMKLLRFFLLPLMLAGCATHSPHPAGASFPDEEQEEYRSVYYDGLWPKKMTPEERDDQKFFYSGLLGKP
jgi:hypothetical protein